MRNEKARDIFRRLSPAAIAVLRSDKKILKELDEIERKLKGGEVEK